MILRAATAGDIPFIVEGFAEIHSELSAQEGGLFKDRLLRDVFGADAKAYVQIYEDGDRTVGFFLYSYCYFASKGTVMWLSQAYIAPAERGKYFRKMFRSIREKAQELGCARVVWVTDVKKDRLAKFWRGLGSNEFTHDFTFWSAKVTHE